MWTPASWHTQYPVVRSAYHYSRVGANGQVSVKKSGLYLLYAQVLCFMIIFFTLFFTLNQNVFYKVKQTKILSIWAVTWQNQQNECAPSEDSDQPGHPPSLIRVFAIRMKKPWVLSYPLSAQRRLWSDWADSHFVGFVMSRLILYNLKKKKNTNFGNASSSFFTT